MLNLTEGEMLAGLGRGKPAPIEKWALVIDMLNVAQTAAIEAFAAAGAERPIRFTAENILVMEYHLLSKVAWVFWLPINGGDQYYTYTFDIGPEVIRDLALAGMWPAIYAMPAPARMN